MNKITTVIVTLAFVIFCDGCAHLPGVIQKSQPPTKTFDEAVHLCRFWANDLVRQRLPLDGATIRPCLRDLGWLPSGESLAKRAQ